MPEPTKVTALEAVRKAATFFAEKGLASPRLDAEVLLAWTLGCTRIQLYTAHDQPLSPQELEASREAIRRRVRGEPVAYITGVKEFRSRSFAVDRHVLCPRPETEHLVDEALTLARAHGVTGTRILEIGVGSGCVAVTLALELEGAIVCGSDRSEQALNCAARNAELLTGSVDLRVGDLFEPWRTEDPFDLILSNPPYLSAAELEAAAPEVRCEPRQALVSEPEAWSVAAAILAQAPAFLSPGGAVLLEMGAGQAQVLARLAAEGGAYGEPRVVRDFGGVERILILRRQSHSGEGAEPNG